MNVLVPISVRTRIFNLDFTLIIALQTDGLIAGAGGEGSHKGDYREGGFRAFAI